MHTGTLSASARNDCPLTRFLLHRRMTGSPMSSRGVSFLDSVSPMHLRYGPSFPEYLRRVDVLFHKHKSMMPFDVCDIKALPHHFQGVIGRIQPMVSPSRKHFFRIRHAQHVCFRFSPLVATMRRHSHFHAQDCYAASHNSMLSRICE
jgi:hypothetical protein